MPLKTYELSWKSSSSASEIICSIKRQFEITAGGRVYYIEALPDYVTHTSTHRVKL
jgi:hypothetical protein